MTNMLHKERNIDIVSLDPIDVSDISMWRSIYNMIPGADGVSLSNPSGVILTEGYHSGLFR